MCGRGREIEIDRKGERELEITNGPSTMYIVQTATGWSGREGEGEPICALAAKIGFLQSCICLPFLFDLSD